ncbi:uncharacterized protein ATC70_000827 [Mucor velutinosus]|uniref:Uncharacterized protein n=1 Tax=Mucor velutinosus TaxID=708070 RepID=A0AAN7DI40_9FUNG|nr:hypothetical protein ATC70_000827 [Mucor velutinosus]
MNNNNNNNNNAASIDFTARLLQEMMAMRSEISQQGVQLNVLNDGFRQQFMSPLEDAGSDLATRSILDPTYRSQVLSNSNRRGPRVIEANPTGRARASPVERYNAMLQHLHKLCNGASVPDLTPGQLKSRREKLHRTAKRVLEAILVMHPNISHWNALDHVQDEQVYYSLALEEQALQRDNLMICLCKKQWCARLLLSQAFKANRASRNRAAAAAAAADAAANVANAANAAANVSLQENEARSHLLETESAIVGDSDIAQLAQTAGVGNAEDDDNLSTTSNM